VRHDPHQQGDRKVQPGQVHQPLVYTIEEAAKVLRIGRSAAYDAARRGDLPTIRVGRSLRVPRHRLDALLGIQNEHEPGGEPDSREIAVAGGDGASTG
jgi:excisionase family DNA binding protein